MHGNASARVDGLVMNTIWLRVLLVSLALSISCSRGAVDAAPDGTKAKDDARANPAAPAEVVRPETKPPTKTAAGVEPAQAAESSGPGEPAEPAEPTPAEAPSAPRVVSITGGLYAVCVLVEDGRVRCSGSGAEYWPQEPSTMLGEGDERAVEITISETDLAARRGDGSILFVPRSDPPRDPLAGLAGERATQVDSGMHHFCAVLGSGRVACWGNNRYGQLGDGTQTDRTEARLVVELEDAVEIAVGWEHSCARRQGGSVVCWGHNRLGQLGSRKARKGRARPLAVTGIEDAIALASGMRANQTCALRSTGVVSCWGSWGMESETIPARLGKRPVDLPALDDVAEIAVNTWKVCARQTRGVVYCWNPRDDPDERPGSDVYAEPEPIFSEQPVVSLASSAFSMQGLREDGSILIEGSISRMLDTPPLIEPMAPRGSAKE